MSPAKKDVLFAEITKLPFSISHISKTTELICTKFIFLCHPYSSSYFNNTLFLVIFQNIYFSINVFIIKPFVAYHALNFEEV